MTGLEMLLDLSTIPPFLLLLLLLLLLTLALTLVLLCLTQKRAALKWK